MNFLSQSSLMSLRLLRCLLVIISVLLLYSKLEVVESVALKGTGPKTDQTDIKNLSSSDSLEQSDTEYSVDIPTLEEDATSNSSESVREKRKLQINPISKKVIMLLYDRDKGIFEENDREKILSNAYTSNFTMLDFMIRLQEKYEYATCNAYLDSAPQHRNNYFQFDEDLVNIHNDDEIAYKGSNTSREERKKKLDETKGSRYALFGEDCDPFMEWNFWRDMFVIAENDTIAVPKKILVNIDDLCPSNPINPINGSNITSPICNITIPTTVKPSISEGGIDPHGGNVEEFDYVQIEPKEMMAKWNEIWIKYQTKKVCNQRLLLECPFEDSKRKCKCRSFGVGLPTIVLQQPTDISTPIPDDIFTTQYYEQLEENVNEETVVHYGKYVHKKKCVLTVNLPYTGDREARFLNPCDFFLPMIGLCRAECHKNATCESVTHKEKAAMTERSKKKDFYKRIKDEKLHELYHQKCVCKDGHICHNITKIAYGEASTLQKNALLVISLIIALSFRNIR